jgi:Na+/H+-dicarboxylate symporter
MLDAIKNALPSYLTGFSTMSSAVTVPVSVECAYKNTHNRPLAMVAMPIMANVHLLGDSIGIPMLAMVTMLLFTGSLPDFAQYVSFVFYFCTAMFAVSGIPGGAILVMTPILVSQLKFSAEMIGVITALFLLMDSFGTAANVMGDGALVIMVDKLLKKLGLHNE